MKNEKYEVLIDIFKVVFFTALLAWFIGVSFVHYMLFALTISNIFLMMLVTKNKGRSDILSSLESESDGKVSRVYDSSGKVIGTKYTEQIENGYWVSVITDAEWNLTAEHIRTFANSEKHKNNRDSLEHKYNKDIVWGAKYYKKTDGLRFAEKMRNRKAMRI
jgi:hypothetical protein